MSAPATILDMCCGSRMFWFDKNDDRAIFSDIRKEEHTLCDGRRLIISLLRAERQGEAGYEAAKGDVNRPDRHLFNRHSDGTGNEERPLRGTNPNRPDGGRCLRSLRT